MSHEVSQFNSEQNSIALNSTGNEHTPEWYRNAYHGLLKVNIGQNNKIGVLLATCKDALEFFVEWDVQNKVISGLSIQLRAAIAEVEKD